jgi:signal transduction histidine kinase
VATPFVERSELERTLPRLRAKFETSRALVEGARARAANATQHAQAMRQLLESRRTVPPQSVAPERHVWDAAAAEVLRATTERDRALGVLAHELRQPLAAAMAAHRLLALNPGAQMAEHARAVVDRQLGHLSNLVERLLDFSRLSLRSLTLERKEVDLRDVVSRAVESENASNSERTHPVILTMPATPLVVCGDATRLLQVFSNLLHNSIRYTDKAGRITLTAAGDGDAARVTVQDDGAGIPAELQPVIFEPFLRGSRDGEGLGIGLALVRRIVELHEGSVYVVSDGVGRGSAFTVTLPLELPSAVPPAP